MGPELTVTSRLLKTLARERPIDLRADLCKKTKQTCNGCRTTGTTSIPRPVAGAGPTLRSQSPAQTTRPKTAAKKRCP